MKVLFIALCAAIVALALASDEASDHERVARSAVWGSRASWGWPAWGGYGWSGRGAWGWGSPSWGLRSWGYPAWGGRAWGVGHHGVWW